MVEPRVPRLPTTAHIALAWALRKGQRAGASERGRTNCRLAMFPPVRPPSATTGLTFADRAGTGAEEGGAAFRAAGQPSCLCCFEVARTAPSHTACRHGRSPRRLSTMSQQACLAMFDLIMNKVNMMRTRNYLSELRSRIYDSCVRSPTLRKGHMSARSNGHWFSMMGAWLVAFRSYRKYQAVANKC